jgi:sugar phosphate isomerase/epimerase
MTPPRPLALQLYTVREALAADRPAALARAAGLGFRAVEAFGAVGDVERTADERLAAARQLRRELDEHGLSVCSVHGPVTPDADFELLFDELQTLGTDTLVVPWPGGIHGVADPLGGADAMKAATERINSCVRAAAPRGLTVGYHNHHQEFAPLPDGSGLTAFDVLWREADPALVAEVDIYWAQTGHGDAAEVVRSLGDRVTLLHVKDGPATTTGVQTTVGNGTLDVPAVLTAATAARWHIVELDTLDGDVFEGAAAGARWCADRGFSRWETD